MSSQADAIAHVTWQLVLILGGVQTVLLALFGWLGRFSLGKILERERAKLELQNGTAVTELKGRLDRSLSATAAALANLASSHQAVQEKRLTAVSILWAELIKIREAASPGLVFFDLLAPEEYDNSLRSNSTIRSMIEKQRGDGGTLERKMYPVLVAVDSQRPFLTDELVGLFSLYRQILGRAMWLLEEGLGTGHVTAWHEDKNLKKIIESLIGAQELERITSPTMKSLTPVLVIIETRIHNECQSIMLGRAATETALAEGHRLMRLADEMQAQTRTEAHDRWAQ